MIYVLAQLGISSELCSCLRVHGAGTPGRGEWFQLFAGHAITDPDFEATVPDDYGFDP